MEEELNGFNSHVWDATEKTMAATAEVCTSKGGGKHTPKGKGKGKGSNPSQWGKGSWKGKGKGKVKISDVGEPGWAHVGAGAGWNPAAASEWAAAAEAAPGWPFAAAWPQTAPEAATSPWMRQPSNQFGPQALPAGHLPPVQHPRAHRACAA